MLHTKHRLTREDQPTTNVDKAANDTDEHPELSTIDDRLSQRSRESKNEHTAERRGLLVRSQTTEPDTQLKPRSGQSTPANTRDGGHHPTANSAPEKTLGETIDERNTTSTTRTSPINHTQHLHHQRESHPQQNAPTNLQHRTNQHEQAKAHANKGNTNTHHIGRANEHSEPKASSDAAQPPNPNKRQPPTKTAPSKITHTRTHAERHRENPANSQQAPSLDFKI